MQVTIFCSPTNACLDNHGLYTHRALNLRPPTRKTTDHLIRNRVSPYITAEYQRVEDVNISKLVQKIAVSLEIDAGHDHVRDAQHTVAMAASHGNPILIRILGYLSQPNAWKREAPLVNELVRHVIEDKQIDVAHCHSMLFLR